MSVYGQAAKCHAVPMRQTAGSKLAIFIGGHVPSSPAAEKGSANKNGATMRCGPFDMKLSQKPIGATMSFPSAHQKLHQKQRKNHPKRALLIYTKHPTSLCRPNLGSFAEQRLCSSKKQHSRLRIMFGSPTNWRQHREQNASSTCVGCGHYIINFF